MKGKQLVAGLGLVLVVIVVVGVVMFNTKQVAEAPGELPPDMEPIRATMTGSQVCLPHKDTDGPQTLECAQGFRSETGEYYVLDFMLMSQLPPDVSNGESFTASGVVTSIATLSTDHWQKYDVAGVFSVTSVDGYGEGSEDVPPVTPPVVKESPTGECYVGGCSSEICSGRSDMASDCRYNEAYACFQTATCERQSTGVCGWTETSELRACLATNGGALDVDVSTTALTSKSWEWVSARYNDGRTVEPKEPGRFVLTFEAGSWSARTDCNGVGGEYVVNGTQITFDELIRSTLMYCGESQEVVFQQLLRDNVAYDITTTGSLVFTLKGDGGTVLFR